MKEMTNEAGPAAARWKVNTNTEARKGRRDKEGKKGGGSRSRTPKGRRCEGKV